MMPSVPSSPESTPTLPVLVGLGGSAGAISALTEFFDHLPEAPGEAFVVVLHMPADEESSLAELLSRHTNMPVRQVTAPTDVKANCVYVAPPDRVLAIEGRTLTPVPFRRPKGLRAPIDQFFRSLAESDADVVGALLSGAGSDGTVGLQSIAEAGGLVAVQDPSEAEYAVMPQSAIQMGRVDLVLPIAELAERIGGHPKTLSRLVEESESQLPEDRRETLLDDIFEQVQAHTGHDFSEYKRSTMLRRIRRRMQVHQIPSLPEYLEFVKAHPEEVPALQKDLLISVTNFFRNPESFEALRDQVIPTLFEGKEEDDALRVWVVGTATGEEAYSLAILLLDHARTRETVPETIQVFATDINEEALSRAREGRYPEPIVADVPEKYLERYFVKEGAQYVVTEKLRDCVLFSSHSLLRDPPFSNLDLISCRNLFIYLRRDLQDAAIDLFQYALNEGGYLFLGRAESVEEEDEHFRMVDRGHRIYQLQKKAEAVPHLPFVGESSGPSSFKSPPASGAKTVPSEAAIHQRLLESFSPPSLVVNDDYRVLHLSADAGQYLEHPPATSRTNVLDLVRPELRLKMRTVLHKAFQERRTVQSKPSQVRLNGTTTVVRLVAHPGPEAHDTDALVLVVFETVEEEGAIPEAEEDLEEGEGGSMEDRLRVELRQARRELQATVEENESSERNLQVANEELRSMNEEYKLTTEELETSKEELRSVNEELKSVNQELEEKVEALREANSDLRNVMASTQIGTLFLDRDLRIQRYTPRVETLFNIRPEDRGRSICDLTHHLDYDSLESDARSVLDDLQPVEREIPADTGECFLVRLHPYRTHDDQVDGVVLSLVDITERREAEQALRRGEEFHRLAVEAGEVGTWSLNLDTWDFYISSKLAEIVGYGRDEFDVPDGHWQQVVPREVWRDAVHPEDRARLEEALLASAKEQVPHDEQFRVLLPNGEVRWIHAMGEVVEDEEGTLHLHGATIDVTERQKAKEKLQKANDELRKKNKQIQSLTDALTSAEEDERQRIAQVLHDDLQQSIFAGLLQVENMEEQGELNEAQQSFLDRAKEQLRESIDVTRTLSRELDPPVEDNSLPDALAWLARQMEDTYDLTVTLQHEDSNGALGDAVRIYLFHLVRELLFNVVKHANVGEAVLQLVEKEDWVRVVVEDEGKGFDPATLGEKSDGKGLASLEERIQLIGGTVGIDAAPGEGSRVCIEVPRTAGVEAEAVL